METELQRGLERLRSRLNQMFYFSGGVNTAGGPDVWGLCRACTDVDGETGDETSGISRHRGAPIGNLMAGAREAQHTDGCTTPLLLEATLAELPVEVAKAAEAAARAVGGRPDIEVIRVSDLDGLEE